MQIRLRSSFALLLAAVLTPAAFALQPQRTWVSGVGDDANPCSRTAPCLTWQGAIDKTAAGGEIDALDPGGFGAVTITKQITLDGGGFVAGILASTGLDGIVINAGANDVVTLRGLDINGNGTGANGVKIMTARVVNIEQSRIYGFGSIGINATGTLIGDVWVKDTRISDCTQFDPAIAVDGTAGAVRAVLNNVEVHHCETGLFVTHGAVVTARNSDFSQNRSLGVGAFSGALVTLDSGSVSECGEGVRSGSTIRLTNMSILDNAIGLFVLEGGSIVSFNNNRFRGNTVDGTATTTLFVK